MTRILMILAAFCGLALAGCNESGPLGQTGLVRASASAAPVALASLEGPPTEMTARFAGALSSQAQARDIVIVPSTSAPRFKLNGYLTAYQSEGGTAVAWVWDVFDNTSHRAQRLTGTELVKASASDPWTAIDDAALAKIAGKSLDGVALFLSGGADAVAAATGTTAPSGALGYAPLD